VLLKADAGFRITKDATRRDELQGLRFRERYVRKETWLSGDESAVKDESVVKDDCTPTQSRAPQSRRMSTQAQIGKVSGLREKFSRLENGADM
jgi:hypothetical protein